MAKTIPRYVDKVYLQIIWINFSDFRRHQKCRQKRVILRFFPIFTFSMFPIDFCTGMDSRMFSGLFESLVLWNSLLTITCWMYISLFKNLKKLNTPFCLKLFLLFLTGFWRKQTFERSCFVAKFTLLSRNEQIYKQRVIIADIKCQEITIIGCFW